MSNESPFGGMPDFPADPEFISAREASRRAVERAGYGSSLDRQRQMNRDREAGLGGPNEPDVPDFLRSRFRSAYDSESSLDADSFDANAPLTNAWGASASSLESVGIGASPTPLQNFDLEALEASAPDLRWAWAEVDLGAIRHNVAVTRQQMNSRTRLMAVVKADAYGHGAIEVSRAALGAGADRLAVATVPEALALRHAGITAPILVLAQPPATSIPLLVHYQITPTIYTPDFAIAYGEVADQLGKKAPFHLAMNTGMNRIGVSYNDVVEFMYQVSFHRALELEGVFTHFATADCHESLEFERQRKRFEDAIINLRAANFNTGIIHAANSAAIYRYPHVHYDMVRLGISLYGFHPCPETRDWVDLQPAMSVHARITDTRMVPMSEGVSYGYTYRSPGSVKVCTLPIGYGDGLSRVLSNNMDVILNGRYYRQVGNICMDQCMFEVDMRRLATVPYYDPQIGDHVLIVGREGAAEITVDELAEKMGTICHQVTIGFGERLQRLYT